MKNEKLNLHIAVIPFENKSGYTAFFAEAPQIIVQAKTKEEGIQKLIKSVPDFLDVLTELKLPEFELTEQTIDLVA